MNCPVLVSESNTFLVLGEAHKKLLGLWTPIMGVDIATDCVKSHQRGGVA